MNISRSAATARFARLPAAIRGAAWMLMAAAAFAGMTVLVRVMGEVMHPFEIAFWRNLFGLLFMMPWLMHVGWRGLRTRHFGGYALRGTFGLSAMMLWFWAITLMPLGEAVALSFTAPLFASLAAVVVLGERMGLRRSVALAAGFVGALIILRPGVIEVGVPAMMVLASSVFIACSVTLVKILSRTENPEAIVVWMGLFMTPVSAIPAALFWTGPTWEQTGLLLLMGALATVGQVGMTRAYAATEATIVLPFDYARLPFAAAIAFVVFAELPDLWTWVGAAVIAIATIYMAHREARLSRAGRRIGTATLTPGGAELAPPPAAGRAPEAERDRGP